jgi:hypothetical protein
MPEAQQTQSLPGSPFRGPIQLVSRSSGARTLGARQIAPSSNPITSRKLSSTSPFPILQPPLRSNSSSQSIPNLTSSAPQQMKPVTLSTPSLSPASQPSGQPQQPTAFFAPLQPQSLRKWSQQPTPSTAAKSPGPSYNIALEPATLMTPSATAPIASPSLFSNATTVPRTLSQLQQPPAFFSSVPLQPQQKSNLPNSAGKSNLDFAGFDPLL